MSAQPTGDPVNARAEAIAAIQAAQFPWLRIDDVRAGRVVDALIASPGLLARWAIEAGQFTPSFFNTPLDCTNNCLDAECDCSGKWITVGYSLTDRSPR